MSEFKRVGERVVWKVRQYGGSVILGAYEPYTDHSVLTSFDGVTYGAIHSRRLTKELDALPARSDERSKAVRAYHEANRQEALATILAAYPEASAGTVDGAEIRLVAQAEVA